MRSERQTLVCPDQQRDSLMLQIKPSFTVEHPNEQTSIPELKASIMDQHSLTRHIRNSLLLVCAWGGVKVMLAFSKISAKQQTGVIKKAIKHGADFFFSIDPGTAAYPIGYVESPSGNRWKFGFPIFYVTDLLQLAEAFVGLGYGDDPRLSNTLKIIREKQNSQGQWSLEYDYTGKTWIDFGKRNSLTNGSLYELCGY
jgi:hypothetical protein